MYNYIIALDLLTPSFQVSYAKKKKHKSLIGVCSTFILASIMTALGIFLGRDIFLRLSPITRINRIFKDDTEISLSSFSPVLAKFVNNQLNPDVFDKHLEISAVLVKIDIEATNVSQTKVLTVRRCLEEDFINFELAKETIGAATKFTDCIADSPSEAIKIKGTSRQNNSQFIDLTLKKKDSSVPLPDKEFVLVISIPLIYVNNSDYENPLIMTSYSFTVRVNPNVMKETVIILGEDELVSDIGLFFSVKENKQFTNFQGRESEILGKSDLDEYAKILFSVSKIQNIFEREYVKLPSVFAELSGIGKFLQLIFQFCLRKISFYLFYRKHAAFLMKTDLKKSENQIDNSTHSVKPLKNEMNMPSLFAFWFMKETNFNNLYVRKNLVEEEFDLRSINRALRRIEEKSKDQGTTINFRKR